MDKLFFRLPEFGVYFYKEWFPMFEEMKHSVKNLILHQGVPNLRRNGTMGSGKHFILVFVLLDDLQQVCEMDK